MTDTQTLSELERAGGPDLILDGYIALALGWRLTYADERPGLCTYTWVPPHSEVGDFVRVPWTEPFAVADNVPQFTASIDAALTLVPKWWKWSVSDYAGAFLHNPNMVHMYHSDKRNAPALSLCIAALKARMEKPND